MADETSTPLPDEAASPTPSLLEDSGPAISSATVRAVAGVKFRFPQVRGRLSSLLIRQNCRQWLHAAAQVDWFAVCCGSQTKSPNPVGIGVTRWSLRPHLRHYFWKLPHTTAKRPGVDPFSPKGPRFGYSESTVHHSLANAQAAARNVPGTMVLSAGS